ncbi:sugar transferase [Micromonospora mirobrigensis]|uniref:Sugar transferase involved in LPS biosynthesis (Colanic, teichoic acid) n=1 Tax=Micromonospora mirobrigensis TaxID=262898 RepID=A0A1C4Z9C5_9ACTN|nr:sugar transferase [Micromonospora mirobrigensis]SCF29593.1 Sugar transferase involved in LPS biosynthesis (colanic, teichoic acid) [Micromonospora mirobrigensis]
MGVPICSIVDDRSAGRPGTGGGGPLGAAAKRVLDLTVAMVALLLVAPLIAVVAVVVLVAMGRPVLFRQVRIGRHGEPFTILKFRSMAVGPDAGAAGDAARLTRLGHWLRTTSLDELPSLWNIVRGDMSLVGPRPLPTRYRFRYTREQFRRHEVRPGLTGLAQVNGRNSLTWEEKFAFDVWYVDHQSLLLDLRIIARTVSTVLRREGISAPGSATAQDFLGPARPGRATRDEISVAS